MILALSLAAAVAVTTLDGTPVNPFEPREPGTRAVVFVFVDPECPISNRYVPELNRLQAAHALRGVTIYAVYSGRAAQSDRARAHAATYALRVPALLDDRFALADAAGATLSAEAAVYQRVDPASSPAWTLVYRGRIDDRAVSLGVWRPVATVRDLADVLARLDRGERLVSRATQAVGCYLRPFS